MGRAHSSIPGVLIAAALAFTSASAAAQEPAPLPEVDPPEEATTSEPIPVGDAPVGEGEEAPVPVPVPAPGEVEDPREGEPGAAAPKGTKKKRKKGAGGDDSAADAPSDGSEAATGPDEAAKPKKKKKKKQAKKKAPKHVVYKGTRYVIGVHPGLYVQERAFSVGARAGIRTDLEPKVHNRLTLGLDYEYEPFSTKTLGFPEEDDTTNTLKRTLVQPIHTLRGYALRRIKWSKLVSTELELSADAWWPALRMQQRWSARLAPYVRIGRASGLYGELGTVLYYKKFPHYFVSGRHIDQEGAATTAAVGYNFARVARLTGGFTFDLTHYLDARYNMPAPDGTYPRANESKTYYSLLPFGEVQVRPVKGLRLRARYSFERQITQNYDRVMTGRDEFFSLQEKYFLGYYDFHRHKGQVRINWELGDRLTLAAMGEAWVRHFDNYEARAADNSWTGQLRLDTEVEGGLEAAVRAASFGKRKRKHDLFVTFTGSHVTRRSNQKRQISLATNFDITRVFLGLELRGR